MHRLLALASLTLPLLACGGGDGGPTGGDCSPTNPCPGGQACDMTNPDGDPVCVDGSSDDDKDGIPASQDFCQHMAGGAFDEDGDGIGDECDACPIARPPAEPETDNDGVDAPCDPDPRLGGAKIVFFDGFNGTTLSDKWKAAAGSTWTVKDGAVSVVAGASDVDLSIGIVPSNKLEIFSEYRVSQPSAASARIGIESTISLPMGDTKITCGGVRSNSMDGIELVTQGSNMQSTDKNLFDSGTRYGLLQQIDVGPVNCAYVSATYQNAISGNTDGSQMNRAGLYAKGATAAFNYILVVEH